MLEPLQPGDLVDIIAPGSQKNPERLKKAFGFLESWGLRVRAPKNLFGEDPFYTNSILLRTTFLRDALEARDSKAVWCLRGGYGSTRLLETLQSFSDPLPEKFFIGFSDITALHLFLYQKWGWNTCHGPTLGQLADGLAGPSSAEALRRYLFKGTRPGFSNLIPLNQAAHDTELLIAPVTGGNTSLIQSSLGTYWQIQTEGTFIFLEDIDEKPYRTLERLEHMRQAGIFDKAKAVFLFDFNFNQDQEDQQSYLYSQAFKQFSCEVSLPVFKGFGMGHTKTNFPFVMGSRMIYKNSSLMPC